MPSADDNTNQIEIIEAPSCEVFELEDIHEDSNNNSITFDENNNNHHFKISFDITNNNNLRTDFTNNLKTEKNVEVFCDVEEPLLLRSTTKLKRHGFFNAHPNPKLVQQAYKELGYQTDSIPRLR